jgi:transposase
MPKSADLSRSLVALDQDSTVIAVIEMSRSTWLVGGLVPGLDREPLKTLDPDPAALLALLERWRAQAVAAGRRITRICVAYEAGRDGFWLARWLRARGIECHVMHPTSIPVSREHRRAKTDRLDIGLLKRSFLGWLRGEPKHCSMVAVPTLEAEDARRPLRERDSLVADKTRLVNRMTSLLATQGIRGFNVKLKSAPQRLAGLRTAEGNKLPPRLADELRHALQRLAAIRARIAELDAAARERLAQAPDNGPNAMIRMLTSIPGVGLDTAETLVREVLGCARCWRAGCATAARWRVTPA